MLLKRKYLFGTTILAGVLAASAPAFAQSSTQLPGVTVQGQSDRDATQVEEVVITGSRIRRDPTNAPTPLIQVSRETLLTAGQTTMIDYLATLPALANSVVPTDTTGSNLNDGGLSFANLRSLGSNRTLVLIDGLRQVGSSQGNLAVDIDTIPRLLIENVEIITGGASSIYGADAVSGVLNFVMRKDFEGLEIDANLGMINQNGELNRRVSALAGANLFDDRLNVYAFGEYEKIDEVQSLDLDWQRMGNVLVTVDADPSATPYDGHVDTALFSHVNTLSRPRWGQTTLANNTPGSPLNDPDNSYRTCTSLTSSNCYGIFPGKTFIYEGSTARLADFGQRLGGALNSTLNIGGDGENPNNFGQETRSPQSESQRYEVGGTFALTPNIDLHANYKHIEEDTFDVSQPTFFDIFLTDSTYASNWTNVIRATSQFDLRYSDNAFLPANVKAAIAGNIVQNYSAPTANAGSVATTTTARQWARHSMFGPQRTQDNHRELDRFVASIHGQADSLLFVKNIDWNLAYTYGEATNLNVERGVDVQRFALAADAVVDTAGALGTPGAIVCRARLIQVAGGDLDDYLRGGLLTDSVEGTKALNECKPLNVFGEGNQSAEALAYVDAFITVSHKNEQEQAVGTVSGQLWDFWGAGPIGVALGVEHRREYTEGVGRSASTGDRLLFLNTGADFPGAEYKSDEVFAEVSLPLLRDSWLGEYAELSGSYRYSDYTTVGKIDVWGANLVYRPIPDITFKTSYNTSVRVPNLGENFSPYSQTFANGFVDPCATANITAQTNTEIRNNRVANCTALAAAQGLSFDFAGNTATNVDDFNPVYGSGVAGVNGGNPLLKPEESTSFTFSTVLQPSFIPNLTVVLDYYEIEITDVIASVSAQTAANNCVNGASLNSAACDTIFRRDPTVGREFYLGAPSGDPIGGFIQGSINYAAITTRGLDFTARYRIDLEELTGHDWGRLSYSVGGLWLIEQEQFLNSTDPTDGTELSSNVFYPRVRLTSSLTYAPNDVWSVNWTMDWQTSQDIIDKRDFLNNFDSRDQNQIATGNFARHDFTVRWNVRDDLSLRAGVVNAFDAEPPAYLGFAGGNFDPWGTRFFFGLNYRPF
ncbi:MAG: TonB-dependent receptor domain-containing protein [Brevundimonas sp.]